MPVHQQRTGTAEGVAMLRAAHLVVDDDPKILRDWVALSLIGSGYDPILRQGIQTLRDPVLSSIRASVLMRSRYTEDQLEAAVCRGVGQYVILSAGLDSFAYRRKDLEKVLRVYEADLPGNLEWKCNRLKAANIEIPGNVVFVPVDFETDTLSHALRSSGFQCEKQAFFSWLGATQYLTEEAVFGTLHDIITIAAPGSRIVFQYSVPDSMLEEEDAKVREFSRSTAGEQGEPWLSLFDPNILASRLEEMGYREVKDFPAHASIDLYFRDRTDGLRPHNGNRLMTAYVGNTRLNGR